MQQLRMDVTVESIAAYTLPIQKRSMVTHQKETGNVNDKFYQRASSIDEDGLFLIELYMPTSNILLPALVGTSAMTLFSYLVSESKHENFREPDVLRQLIKRLPKTGSNDSAQLAGWSGHYAAGLMFVLLYHQLWKQNKIKPSIVSGVLLGAGSGLAGIIVWKIAFVMHPNPQRKNLNKYFRHLLFAHVVFGIFSALTYNVTRSGKNK